MLDMLVGSLTTAKGGRTNNSVKTRALSNSSLESYHNPYCYTAFSPLETKEKLCLFQKKRKTINIFIYKFLLLKYFLLKTFPKLPT